MRYIFTGLIFLLSGLLEASPLNNIVIFGDSLSDNGNLYEYMQHKLPASPPYYQGRFSNGQVWIEYLSDSYFSTTSTQHLLNYAFGGAGATENPDSEVLFTLKREIDSYLLAHQERSDPQSLFIVWIGSNDYLGLTDDTINEDILVDVNTSIKHGLQRLAQTGAKYILILNLPDLGRTPAARLFNVSTLLTKYTNQHNARLQQLYHELQQQYPAVRWIYYDVDDVFNRILIDPAKYGFTNVIDTCYTIKSNRASVNHSILKIASNIKKFTKQINCDEYLFFDPIHPTAKLHQLMAIMVRNLLDSIGITFNGHALGRDM